MTKTDRNFSNELFSIALSPDRFYEFAHIFNSYLDLSEGDDGIRRALKEDDVLKAIEVADLFIDKETSKSQSLRHSVNRANHPMVALDSHGQVLEINDIAKSVFSLTRDDVPFQYNFTEKSQNDLKAYLNKISVQHFEPTSNFIDLIELERENPEQTYFVCLTPWKLDGNTHCLLIQAINIRWPDHMTPLLKKTFNLTNSEIEVFRLISDGVSVNDIANRRQTSITTVRTQIRDIYAKTSTNSQLQFIRLAVSLASLTFDENSVGKTLVNADGNKTFEPPYPREEHWHLLKLPDGRKLDYAVFGHPNGIPCLFFHNELFGDLWPTELTHYATQKGLKIILPARPYYRRSSGYPKGVKHPTQTAKDFSDLLEHLNIPSAKILSQTLGGMFALEFTDLYPEKVQSLTTISPILPFATQEQQSNMPPLHRFISTLMLSAPWMVEFVARAGYAFYLRDGPEKFLRQTFASAPVDKATLDNPAYMKNLCHGLKFGEPNAYRPYAAGWKHLVPNSEEKIRKIKVPMSLIIGEKDQNTRFDRANSLLEAGIKLNIVSAKDGGELLILTHPKVIIDTVLEN
ncbi:alpha/beta fold hydrolase [Hellea balneolensis]|uniref:alpha/beta fold hydrolase n=1 Tax=Hellea balneolensis TaxID=287478 RepID=UPI00041B3480|nr:alpha/beta fold hydrolase [Hellea balneolensis]